MSQQPITREINNKRIGGWLLAPLAYLVVTLMSVVLMLVLFSMALFMPESRDYLLTNSQAFTLQWYFSVVTTLAMGAFTVAVLWQFCKRTRVVPKMYIIAPFPVETQQNGGALSCL